MLYNIRMSEYVLLASVYGLLLATMLAGYIFLRRVTDGDFSIFKKTGKVITSPFLNPKIGLVVLLLVIGFSLFIFAPQYLVYYTVTGYRYYLDVSRSPLRYIDTVCRATGGYVDESTVMVGQFCSFIERTTLDRAVTDVRLVETPVTTPTVVTLFRAEYVLGGLFFILLGVLLAAVFLVRANNRLYSE